MSIFNLACEIITDRMTEDEIYDVIKRYPAVIDMREPPIYRTLDDIVYDHTHKKRLTKEKKRIII